MEGDAARNERKPVRIQRKGRRDINWKSPRAVFVGRPTRWGNPFTVRNIGLQRALELYEEWVLNKMKEDPSFLSPLKGKDLVCYCPLNRSCHADILLKLANKTN